MKRVIGFVIATVILILMLLSNHSPISKLLCVGVYVIGVSILIIRYYKLKK